MAVVIGEVVSEVVLTAAAPQPTGGPVREPDDALVDRIVRQAAERVMEQLRREWEVS